MESEPDYETQKCMLWVHKLTAIGLTFTFILTFVTKYLQDQPQLMVSLASQERTVVCVPDARQAIVGG